MCQITSLRMIFAIHMGVLLRDFDTRLVSRDLPVIEKLLSGGGYKPDRQETGSCGRLQELRTK